MLLLPRLEAAAEIAHDKFSPSQAKISISAGYAGEATSLIRTMFVTHSNSIESLQDPLEELLVDHDGLLILMASSCANDGAIAGLKNMRESIITRKGIAPTVDEVDEIAKKCAETPAVYWAKLVLALNDAKLIDLSDILDKILVKHEG